MRADHDTCGNKRRYWSEVDAEIAREKVERRFNRRMVKYKCPTCQGWHLATHKSEQEK